MKQAFVNRETDLGNFVRLLLSIAINMQKVLFTFHMSFPKGLRTGLYRMKVGSGFFVILALRKNTV